MKTKEAIIKDTDSLFVEKYPSLKDLSDEEKNGIIADLIWCINSDRILQRSPFAEGFRRIIWECLIPVEKDIDRPQGEVPT